VTVTVFAITVIVTVVGKRSRRMLRRNNQPKPGARGWAAMTML